MKITSIRISSFLGIKELQITPGSITEISGKNGAGKSSFIEAIKTALKTANDASLIQNGAEKAEIGIVFDNGLSLIRTITPKGAKLDLIDEIGRSVKKPQTVLEELYDLLSVNPIEFLATDKKKRTEIMLQTLPLELPEGKLEELTSENLRIQKIVASGLPALDKINMIYDELYAERKDINKDANEKNASVNQLEETLVEIDFNPEEILSKMEALETKLREWETKRDEYKNILTTTLHAKQKEIQEHYESELSRINSEREQGLDNAKGEYDKGFQSIDIKFSEKTSEARAELATLRQKQTTIGSIMKTKELIRQYTDESKRLSGMSDKISEKLDKIKAMKTELLSKMPIPGLEIQNGEIIKDGVPFEHLNTASQISIAFEIAKLRAGKLGIVCVDGLERFDSEQRAVFIEKAKDTGLQFFVTSVSDDESLTIKTNE